MITRLSAVGLGLGLAISASSVHAETTPIFQAPIGAQEASKSNRFGINQDLGRAWVEIDIYRDPIESTDTYRVPVPGLSYNKETAQVVYAADGKSVVCANVRDVGSFIFKHQRIEPTGDCELTRKYVKAPVDNGFSIDVIEHFEVHFKPVNPVSVVPVNIKNSS